MKINIKKELPIWFIIAIPFIYLAYVWKDLPEKVPMHWNILGEIDRWGDKQELLIIPFVLPLLVYLVFLLVPLIDPKRQINKMGGKYYNFKFILTLFVSVIALFVIYTAKNQSLSNPNYIFIFIGFLFAVMGNFFKTIRPNYFIGIKTPWTLENETVWKETHLLAGKLWFVGGLLIILCSLVFNKSLGSTIFITITIIISVIPIVFSYLRFNKLNKNNSKKHKKLPK